MKNVIGFNVVFSGSLKQVWHFLQGQDLVIGVDAGKFALVPKSAQDVALLEENTMDGESLDVVPFNIYEIRSPYSYGFDICDASGCAVEIKGNDVGEFFVIDGLEQGAELKAVEVKDPNLSPCPDVSRLSSDSLFTIVDTYDSIHQAAVIELKTRIDKVSIKLTGKVKE